MSSQTVVKRWFSGEWPLKQKSLIALLVLSTGAYCRALFHESAFLHFEQLVQYFAFCSKPR